MYDRNPQYVGKKINDILITDCVRLAEPSGRYKTFFQCVCFCGETFNARAESIKKGTTKSCGCITGYLSATKTASPNNDHNINSLIMSYKNNAKAKKILYNISKELFLETIYKNCHYCDSPPSREWVGHRARKNYFGIPIIYNGIDRINSDLGYHPDNILPACYICNNGKRDSTYDEFISWIHRIVLYTTTPHNNYLFSLENKNITNDQKITFNYPSIDINAKFIGGEIFSYLTFQEYDSSKSFRRYKCICVCGKTAYRGKAELLKGLAKSCGCKKGLLHSLIITKPNGHSQFSKLFREYIANANKRDINFLLSFDEFKSIIVNNCNYCGLEPRAFNLQNFGIKNHTSNPIYYNGIDRIDSTQSYQTNNCVPSCSMCNRTKNRLTPDEFMSYISKLITKYRTNISNET